MYEYLGEILFEKTCIPKDTASLKRFWYKKGEACYNYVKIWHNNYKDALSGEFEGDVLITASSN